MISAQAEIIALEGLDAAGKTAVSAALASLTGGIDITAELGPVIRKNRAIVNQAKSTEGRCHYWLSVNHLAGELAADAVARGQAAIIDSYFFRTIATHRVLGMELDPDFILATAARPNRAVLLTVPEATRHTRLAARTDSRDAPVWHASLARQSQRVLREYRKFGLAEIDTSGSPQDAAARILLSCDSRRFYFGAKSVAASAAIGAWRPDRR